MPRVAAYPFRFSGVLYSMQRWKQAEMEEALDASLESLLGSWTSPVTQIRSGSHGQAVLPHWPFLGNNVFSWLFLWQKL